MTFALPVLVMVTLWIGEEVPVVTFPKLKLTGLMSRVRVGAIPEPLRATEVGEVAALLTIETFPDTDTTLVGRKATVIVLFCPAFTFRGREKPLALNAAPVTVTCVRVSVAVPVLEITNACDKLVPVTAFPKLMDVGLTWIAGVGTELTVRLAALLVAEPAEFVTTTRYVDPLSAVVVAGVV